MRRRKLLVALAGLAVVVAAGAVVLWQRQSSRITQENFDRIRDGMSRAEVEEILGSPGDYRTGPGATNLGRDVIMWVIDPDVHPYPPSSWSKIDEGPHSWGYWLGDSFQISVAIDDSGQVQEMHGFPRRTTQGVFDNLLWRAKRQWHRWFP
jgi:hypothetical protein